MIMIFRNAFHAVSAVFKALNRDILQIELKANTCYLYLYCIGDRTVLLSLDVIIERT